MATTELDVPIQPPLAAVQPLAKSAFATFFRVLR